MIMGNKKEWPPKMIPPATKPMALITSHELCTHSSRTRSLDPQLAQVFERAKHPDGSKIGSPHRNPMSDARKCFLEFPDQSLERHSANVIAENLCSQCDSKCCRFNVLEEIVDHRITSEALHGDDAYKTLKNGQKVPKQTTKGHQLLL